MQVSDVHSQYYVFICEDTEEPLQVFNLKWYQEKMGGVVQVDSTFGEEGSVSGLWPDVHLKACRGALVYPVIELICISNSHVDLIGELY